MTVRLRPHHLLCMLTYVGEGYSASFVENYDQIAARLSAGEDALIVEGPDDVCAPLLRGDAPHCHNDSVRERDRLAAGDVGALLQRPILPGTSLRLDRTMLAAMRAAFEAGVTRTACGGCQWVALCDRIAATGFSGKRLESKRVRI